MPHFDRRAFLRVGSIAASSRIRTAFRWSRNANLFNLPVEARESIAQDARPSRQQGQAPASGPPTSLS